MSIPPGPCAAECVRDQLLDQLVDRDAAHGGLDLEPLDKLPREFRRGEVGVHRIPVEKWNSGKVERRASLVKPFRYAYDRREMLLFDPDRIPSAPREGALGGEPWIEESGAADRSAR